ncbi:hypothetical protein [Bernardetia sp.]|uniref:hypothetical protein n=1 Tax=Bernardetia sp. TaxID=1937974 RepID=UPI0025BE72C9|nr:hypothetical protein [Bernardetia sp.]
MKDENIYSYFPKYPNQKIWRVCPDPKSDLVALEIREKQQDENISELLILDVKNKQIVGNAQMEATQTLLNFFDKILLLSEIDMQSELPISKGIQALNTNFETIWQLEEVSYYDIFEDNENNSKVIFSLQSNYYSVPLIPKSEEIEAKEESYSNLKNKVKKYFHSTHEYPTNHTNYSDILDFILGKTKHIAEETILYTENEKYLLCSYVVENKNYLLCTDKNGNLKHHFLIKEIEEGKNTDKKNPQDFILMENKILWMDKNKLSVMNL